jgi:hypothetical protein
MQLIEIDKARYRKNLNIVIVGFIATLLVLSLAFGAILIELFGEVDIASVVETAIENGTVEEPSNFKYNFLGVFLALLACAAALHTLKNKEYFHEIYYVWKLKQIHNSVFRKLKAIKAASQDGDINALIILNFYYTSQKQVYLLDDNTLIMSKLNKDIENLNEIITNKNLTITTDQFDKSLLASY